MTTKKSSRKRTTGGTEKRPAKRKKMVSLAEYEADAQAAGTSAPPAAHVGAGAKKTAKADQTAKERTPAAPRKSLANTAILVLADAKEPMNAKAIVDAAIAAGWYEPGKGKTPHATLYSSMLREARDDSDKARFRKAKRGMWELTEAGKAQAAAIKEAFAAK